MTGWRRRRRGYGLIRAGPASRELSRREAGRHYECCAWKIRTREMVIMNSRNLRIFVAASSLGLVVAGRPAGAGAQAPAGPLPAAQPQPPPSPDARPPEQRAP